MTVDVVHGAITIARSRWGHLNGLRFVHAEATAYLADRPGEHDVVCSIFGALSFTGPSLLGPVVGSLRPSGTLAVSVRLGARPSDRSADEWRALVTGAGIEVHDWLIVPDPIDDSPPCLIFTGKHKKAT